MKKVLDALIALQVKMPIETILLILLVATILAMIIYLTYKYTFSGVVYNQRFNVSLVMITVVTTIVMVVIGSNISVSLGMVGALSIVRFRTAIKDPRDTAFIFWGIVTGLACGTQNYYVAILGVLFVAILLFVFKKFMIGDNKYVLIVRGTYFNDKEVEKTVKSIIKDYVCKGKYFTNNSSEVIYEVKIKNRSDVLIDNIRKIQGVDTINIVQCNTETMG